MNSIGRNGIPRVSLDSVISVSGIDFEGSEIMRFLRLRRGLRSLSRSTAWSRPRSRGHFKVDTPSYRVRRWMKW